MTSGKGTSIGIEKRSMVARGQGREKSALQRTVLKLLCNLIDLLQRMLTIILLNCPMESFWGNAGIRKRKLSLGVQNTQGRIPSSCRNPTLGELLNVTEAQFPRLLNKSCCQD